MKNFFRKHPIIFAFFILFCSRIIGLGVTYFIHAIFPEVDPVADLGWLLQLLFASTSIALVYWSGDAKEFGFLKPKTNKEWLLWVPVLIIPIYIFATFGYNVPDFSRFMILAIAALCVAINEETIFRGVIVKGFLRFGIVATLFLPSVLFGLLHVPNFFVGGNATFTIFQVVWTISAGVALTAMRLRNGSIYPVIVFHFLLDITEYSATNEYGVHDIAFSNTILMIFATLNVLFMAYALVLFKQGNKFINRDNNMSV